MSEPLFHRFELGGCVAEADASFCEAPNSSPRYRFEIARDVSQRPNQSVKPCKVSASFISPLSYYYVGHVFVLHYGLLLIAYCLLLLACCSIINYSLLLIAYCLLLIVHCVALFFFLFVVWCCGVLAGCVLQ